MYYVFVEYGFKLIIFFISVNSSGFYLERSDFLFFFYYLSGSVLVEFVVGLFYKDDGIDIEDFEDEIIDVDMVELKRK